MTKINVDRMWGGAPWYWIDKSLENLERYAVVFIKLSKLARSWSNNKSSCVQSTLLQLCLPQCQLNKPIMVKCSLNVFYIVYLCNCLRYVKVIHGYAMLLQRDSRADSVIAPTHLCVVLPSTMNTNLPPPLIGLGMYQDVFLIKMYLLVAWYSHVKLQ